MSHLILLRQVVQKQHFLMQTYFQQVNKITQCAVWQQKSKGHAGVELKVGKSGASLKDISSDVGPLGEKTKEDANTSNYISITFVGFGATAIMFWAIWQELCSKIYSNALGRVIEDPQVLDSLGAPIKGFVEDSGRKFRQYVAHTIFNRNDVPYIRMEFHVQGTKNKATVHLESRVAFSGQMEYRYLFVQLDDHYPHSSIILEGNRASDPVDSASTLSESDLSLESVDVKN